MFEIEIGLFFKLIVKRRTLVKKDKIYSQNSFTQSFTMLNSGYYSSQILNTKTINSKLNLNFCYL